MILTRSFLNSLIFISLDLSLPAPSFYSFPRLRPFLSKFKIKLFQRVHDGERAVAIGQSVVCRWHRGSCPQDVKVFETVGRLQRELLFEPVLKREKREKSKIISIGTCIPFVGGTRLTMLSAALVPAGGLNP